MAGDAVPPGGGTQAQLTWAADACLHAAPGRTSDPEEVGPFTLFRPRGSHPYYARPRPGAPTPTADDLQRLDRRCAELVLPLTVHWLQDRAPSLGALCREHGLVAHLHPLLVTTAGSEPADGTLQPGVEVEVLTSRSDDLVAALACSSVAFAAPGVDVGTGGTDEVRVMGQLIPDERIESARSRVADGTTAWVVAREGGSVLAAAQCLRVGASALVTSVATLPSARRRGLARAVTARLARDAFDHGVRLLVLVADDERVSTVFEQVGFDRLGWAGLATR